MCGGYGTDEGRIARRREAGVLGSRGDSSGGKRDKWILWVIVQLGLPLARLFTCLDIWRRQWWGRCEKALSQNLQAIDEIVSLYALVNRIRLFASEDVLKAAEAFVKKLVGTYGENNLSIEQIKAAALEQHVDPLNDFALKCRAELHKVYTRGAWRK